MIGNSSSGIVEAPSFKLPVVNIGSRQEGRIRAANVIDVGYTRQEIINGIEKAISEEFRYTLQNLVSPFGDGHAADRIVEGLRNVQINSLLLKKKFVDLKRC
jgi:UDP-N-acetylglucosamine 2-epimerase (non-hydrolysing)/GDP/UDP-N,N'-diacetylbacillosamine 2-epimerase (hydrolysing)